MLVLSRSQGAAIMVGNDIKIRVIEVRGNQVRLGISAPKEVPVHRQEVYDAIQKHAAEAQPELSAEYDAQGRFLPCGTL